MIPFSPDSNENTHRSEGGNSHPELPDERDLHIPDHTLIRRIGRGSYGVVWLARNTMGIHRAVKIVFRRSFEDYRPFERELEGIRKFEPVSRSHPGFVNVLHIGIDPDDEYFFYIMELGDDRTAGSGPFDPAQYHPKTLASEIRRCGRLPWREASRLGLTLSHALSELHKNGLVHRDVKPSNIIFGNGIPKLADIGLVSDAGQAHSFVGTEGFIPPEGPGTEQADVYGLGKVLYEACTGKDRNDFPDFPSLTGSAGESDGFIEMNEILLQACHHDRSKRYQSAWEMHTHLLLLENGKSVRRLKQLEGWLQSVKKAAVVVFVLAAAVGLVGYNLYMGWRNRIQFQEQQRGASEAFGVSMMEQGDLSKALPHFARALDFERASSQEVLRNRIRFFSSLSHLPRLTHTWFEPASVEAAGFLPGDQQAYTLDQNGTIRIRNLDRSASSAGEVFSIPMSATDAAVHTDGEQMAVSGQDGKVAVWNLSKKTTLAALPHPDSVMSVSYSFDGTRLAAACWDRSAYVYDTVHYQLQHRLEGHEGALLGVCFSPDGRWIATTGTDSTVRLWNAASGAPHPQVLKHSEWVYDAEFSPDSRRLSTASFDRAARLWEVDEMRLMQPLMEHGDGIHSVSYSSDGTRLATASLDKTVRIWDSDSHQPIEFGSILYHSDRVLDAAYDASGNRIVTGCIDGSVRVWDFSRHIPSPELLHTPHSMNGRGRLTVSNQVASIQDNDSAEASRTLPLRSRLQSPEFRWSTDDQRIIASQIDGSSLSMEQWDAASGKSLGPVIQFDAFTEPFSMETDGQSWMVWSTSRLQVGEVDTGNTVLQMDDTPEPIQGATLAGNSLVLWKPNQVEVIALGSGRLRYDPIPVQDGMAAQHVGVSPDHRWMAPTATDSLFRGYTVRLRHLSTGEPAGAPLQHGDGVLHAAFNPRSTQLVTSSEDFHATIWSVPEGLQIARMSHDNQVLRSEFSADGNSVITMTLSRKLRLWDAETGRPLTPSLKHNTTFATAGISPNGHRVLFRDHSGKQWQWVIPGADMPPEDILSLASLLNGTTDFFDPGQSTLIEHQTLNRRLREEYPHLFQISE